MLVLFLGAGLVLGSLVGAPPTHANTNQPTYAGAGVGPGADERTYALFTLFSPDRRCVVNRTLKLQKKVSGSWKTIASDTAKYSNALALVTKSFSGDLRFFAPAIRLSDGTVCSKFKAYPEAGETREWEVAPPLETRLLGESTELVILTASSTTLEQALFFGYLKSAPKCRTNRIVRLQYSLDAGVSWRTASKDSSGKDNVFGLGGPAVDGVPHRVTLAPRTLSDGFFCPGEVVTFS